MKKHITYLTFALLLLAGCGKSDFGADIVVPDGEMLVRLGVSAPMASASTRSYVSGTETAVSSIVMLCFDAEGKFITDRAASLTPESDTKGLLTGTVPANTCRIHFVANFDGLNLSAFGMGSPERSMMKSDALSSGISDDVRFWGYHTASSKDEMKTWLSGGNTVKLLRDRAKVVLKNGDSKITSLSWTIGNGVNKGYVAPTTASGVNPYTNDYETSTRLTEYTASGRYATLDDSDAIWAAADEPQFLFENANSQSDPVKVIIKATYQDATVRYHTVLLQSNENVPYPVVRNQTFILTVVNLPKTVGSDNLADALATTDYSNNPYAQVAREVDEVSSEQFTLKVEDIIKMFNEDGDGVISFTYTGHDGGDISGLNASNFDVSWEGKSGSDETDDVVATDASTGDLAVPTVTFNSSTGEGTITFPLATLSGFLKHNSLQIVAKNSGLSRFVDVYSITSFSFSTDPELTDNDSFRTAGGYDREVYKLTFSLPPDYPSALYPVKVKMYTSTLSPFSDNTASAVSGAFNVVVESSSELSGSSSASDWNYLASGWGQYFEYVIPEPSADNSYTIYLNEVVENLSRDVYSVGLYFQIDGFGDPIPLSCPYTFLILSPETQKVSYNATSATFRVKVAGSESWTISPGEGVTVNPTSGTGSRDVTMIFAANSSTSALERTATVTTSSSKSKTATVTQATGASFSASDFTFSNYSSSSTKNGVTVSLTNSSKNNNNITVGRSTGTQGVITVTPPAGKTITSIKVTYRNGYTNQNTVGVSSDPASYTISGSTGTWSGSVSAGGSVKISMGYSRSGFITYTYTYPQITGIEVSYE